MITEVEMLTILATGFTNGAGFPQMVRTIRTRSTRDISFRFLIFLIIGLSSWEAYAIVTEQIYFIIGNSFGLTMWTIVLVIKIKKDGCPCSYCSRKKDKQGPPPFLWELPPDEQAEIMKKIGWVNWTTDKK